MICRAALVRFPASGRGRQLLAGFAAGAAYVVHRHPTWSQPLGAAFGAVTVMVALVGVILAR
ncbi:hypothetical protein OG933_45040 (plasmid) [Streptomyces sp. NBC_00016]|uniref:hypothetical protein n=1 Tax=Streptomyces sp. NBC_00016 TaxID=2975622 RepID=UPI002F91807A